MAKFSLNHLFGTDDYEEETYYEEPEKHPAVRNSKKIVPISGARDLQPTRIALFEPRIYSDVKEIANQLLSNQAVIVNFTQMDNGVAKRIIDFLNGTIYAIEGNMERVGDQIFLCTPKNYEVSGSLSSNIANDTDNFN